MWWIAVFAAAFGFVEASVVVYLRSLYYPTGFTFPLTAFSPVHLPVELAREVATLVMLLAVAFLTGRTSWQRTGFFMMSFGAWDIWYYIWLKVMLGWPVSILDWDILFLLPLPWIGPVVAPVVISVLLIGFGLLIVRRDERGLPITASPTVWLFALLGTALIFYTFMNDLDATIRFRPPRPYRYDIFAAGLLLYIVAGGMTLGKRLRQVREDIDYDRVEG